MLARRIIALSADKAFGKHIATALKAAGGTVDLHQTIDELGRGEIQAALLVLHLDGELVTAAAELLPRLSGDARVIAILPRGNLPAVVDTMLASDRVAAMLTAESFDPRDLAAVATRTLVGDIFGLEKLTRWGTLVHSQLVGDYQEKSLAISQISEFAETMGVRRKYREAIEQCLDEMLMNALYDAPVDDQGKPIFSEIPIKTRISLRVEQKVVVQYACDGMQFCISVRDAFGTLERATMLGYLHKCLHSEQQIDRKAGGAGLGLYLMVNSATSVIFNVLPGIATEVSCVFGLDSPKLQLDQLGFYTERIDAAGRLATGPSKKLPAGAAHVIERRRGQDGDSIAAPPTPQILVRLLVVAIFAMCMMIGFVAWPRLFGSRHLAHVSIATSPPGAAIEVEGHAVGRAEGSGLDVPDLEIGRAYLVVARLDGYEPQQGVVQPRTGGTNLELRLRALAATVELDSQPSGAGVEIAGKQIGNTPVRISTLAPSSTTTIVFHKSGYQDATAQLDVPEAGKTMRMVQPLVVAAELARVELDSDPPGAQVVQNGQLLAGVQTPAQVLVEADHTVKFALTMQHRVPAVIELTPGHGAEIVKHAKLVEGFTVAIDANLDGMKVTLSPSCQQVALPATCVVPKGNYQLELEGATNAHVQKNLAVTADTAVHVQLGYVEATSEHQIVLGPGRAAKKVVLEVGRRSVTVTGEDGPHNAVVTVKAGATVLVQ
jgi:PEGA domain